MSGWYFFKSSEPLLFLPPLKDTLLDQGQQTMAQSSPLRVLVNEVLLAHTHMHLSMQDFERVCTATTDTESCCRRHVVTKTATVTTWTFTENVSLPLP